MIAEDSTVSKAVHRRHRPRRRVYLDWASGDGFLDTGKAVRVPPRAHLSRVVEEVPPETQQVFLCGQGQGKGGLLAWLKEPKLLEEWEDAGTHPEKDRFVIRLKHQRTERRLELYSLSTWFDPDVSPGEARAALALLGELLASKFPGAVVLPTPAQTGLDLWDRRKSGSEYPVLPEDIRELIRSTSTQGRVETDLAATQEELPGFFYLDTRFAYAAFTWKMPVGDPKVDDKPIHDPYRPGRYLIKFQVPNNWHHIGIFGVTRKEYVAGSNKNWDYLSEPGTVWETWVDHAELLLAEQFGWNFKILQRILFNQPDRKGAAPEPLKAWRSKLVELREWVEAAPKRGEIPERTAKLLSGALRNILLQAVGAFHSSRRTRYHTILKHQLHQIPKEYMGNLGLPEGNYLTYWEPEPVSRYRLEHSHPEWSSTIWAKAHARMLYSNRFGQGETGALTLPREDLVAIRNDALYLTRDPGWSETGKIGELRKKGAIIEAVQAPKTDTELNDLRDRSEREWGRG